MKRSILIGLMLLAAFRVSAGELSKEEMHRCDTVQNLTYWVMYTRQAGDPIENAEMMHEVGLYKKASSYQGDDNDWFNDFTKKLINKSYQKPVEAINDQHAKIIAKQYGSANYNQCVEHFKAK